MLIPQIGLNCTIPLRKLSLLVYGSLKMKKIILILTVLLSTTALFAQNDAKAKGLLTEVSNKAKSYKNISIDFKYVLENLKENINQETRGDVVMEGNKYKLNILGITRIFDGKKL